MSAMYPAYGITLQDAIEKALAYNPDYQSQIKEYEKTLPLRIIAGGAVMPSVAIDVSSTLKNDKRNSGPKQEYTRDSMGLVVRQTVYKGGAIWHARDQAEIKIDQAREQLRAQEQSLTLQVIESYINILVARETLILRQSALRSATNNLETTIENTESGVTASEELLNAQSQYATASANTTAAQGQVNISENAYFALVGERAGDDMDDLVLLANEAPFQDKTVDDLIELGLRQNPEIKVARLALDVAEYQVKIQQADMYPTVNLEYKHTRTRDDYRGAPTTNNKNDSFGVSARIPLYQQGVVQAKIRQSRLSEKQAINKVESTLIINERDIRRYWMDSQVTDKTVKAYKLAWLALDKRLVSVRDEFESGVKSLSDLNTLETDVDKARISYINALKDKLLANYRLRAAVGDLVPALAEGKEN